MTHATDYTIEQIYDMILSYHNNKKMLQGLKSEYMTEIKAGGSIAQYGIESVMPKAIGQTGDITFSEVNSILKKQGVIDRTENKVRYIEHRWHRITDEHQATIFKMILDGRSITYTAKMMQVSRHKVRDEIMAVAEILK